ncbi:MAG: hypothetical protein ACRD8W_30680, partial [Nitrososphaeraceae archaeon]
PTCVAFCCLFLLCMVNVFNLCKNISDGDRPVTTTIIASTSTSTITAHLLLPFDYLTTLINNNINFNNYTPPTESNM